MEASDCAELFTSDNVVTKHFRRLIVLLSANASLHLLCFRVCLKLSWLVFIGLTRITFSDITFYSRMLGNTLTGQSNWKAKIM